MRKYGYRIRCNLMVSYKKMFDVAVIGAGPSGCAAAKRCAENGLQSVILEKKKLPREKVCSGMIIGPLAHTLIKQEFGLIPDSVLCQPPQLMGYRVYTPDTDSTAAEKLDLTISLTSRRDLDFWMSEAARAKGAQIRTGAKATGIIEKGSGFLLRYESGQGSEEIEARYLIGADGGTSVVRKFLFPNLKVPFTQAYEEWFPGSLGLDPRYFHWFYLQKDFPGGFAVHQKDGFIVLEFGGSATVPKERIKWAKDYLAESFSFDQSQAPVWRGACPVVRLAGGLVSGAFRPARKNVLLAGEAGGLVIPITAEGIGTSLKSGFLAAEAITQAVESNHPAEHFYLAGIESLTRQFKEFSHWFGKLEEAVKGRSGQHLRQTLAETHQASLNIF
jgi:flavin-dependent dehydrogenase